MRHSVEQARLLLAERLRGRLPELKTAIATRVYSISDPREVSDPAYVEGLNAALAAAVEYRLEVLEVGERSASEVPAALMAQARLDARDRVPLDTVLRRYFAGNALFADFLAEEAEREGVPNATLRSLLAAQATVGDRLLAAVSAEHAREAQVRPSGTAERRRETVKRLLAGEFVDHAELEYDLEAQHLGLMAKGQGVEPLLRELAKRLDRRLLAVKREEEPTWAVWLGGNRALEAEDAVRVVESLDPKGATVTVGEPAEGLAGWRFSHLQAKAALAVAERRGVTVARYADVAIEAATLRDDLLARSLRQLYLEPLEQMRDGGKDARDTPARLLRGGAERLLDRRRARRRPPHRPQPHPRDRGADRPAAERRRGRPRDRAAERSPRVEGSLGRRLTRARAGRGGAGPRRLPACRPSPRSRLRSGSGRPPRRGRRSSPG